MGESDERTRVEQRSEWFHYSTYMVMHPVDGRCSSDLSFHSWRSTFQMCPYLLSRTRHPPQSSNQDPATAGRAGSSFRWLPHFTRSHGALSPAVADLESR
jgi:hypothetical protein